MKRFVAESWLVLLLAVVFGLAMAQTYGSLKDRIAANEKAALEQAVYAVIPGAKSLKEHKVGKAKVKVKVYEGLDAAGRRVGFAVPTEGFGFQGPIKVVIGIDAAGQEIRSLEILAPEETPGLGSRVQEDFFKKQRFEGRTTQKDLQVVKVPPTQPEVQVQAITGATISSEAVVKIVNKRMPEIRAWLARQAKPK